jgi:hypothetical protein
MEYRGKQSLTRPLPLVKGEGHKIPRPSGVSSGSRRFVQIQGKFLPTGRRYATEIHLDGQYHSRMIADAFWDEGSLVQIEVKRGTFATAEILDSEVTVQTTKGGDYVRLVRVLNLVSAGASRLPLPPIVECYKVPKLLDTVTMFFDGDTYLGMTDLDCQYLKERNTLTITDLTPGHMGDKKKMRVLQNTPLISLHWDKRYEKFSQLKRVVLLKEAR